MKLTMLVLALLLSTPLIGLAAPPQDLLPLTGPSAPSYNPAPLTLCASLPTTGAPRVGSKQDLSGGVVTLACYYTLSYTCATATQRSCTVSDCPTYNTCVGTPISCLPPRQVQCCS